MKQNLARYACANADNAEAESAPILFYASSLHHTMATLAKGEMYAPIVGLVFRILMFAVNVDESWAESSAQSPS